jgi:hypothetical protein
MRMRSIVACAAALAASIMVIQEARIELQSPRRTIAFSAE